MSVETKLRELGIVLPPAPAGVGAYVPWVRTGNLVITSGQLPWRDGKLTHVGKIATDVSIDQGYDAARICAINAIAQLKAAVLDLDRIAQIVRLEGFVHPRRASTSIPRCSTARRSCFSRSSAIAAGTHASHLASTRCRSTRRCRSR